MEDIFYMILGGYAMYSLVHYYVIQFTKTWKQRSGYEKFLTIWSAVIILLLWAGLE